MLLLCFLIERNTCQFYVMERFDDVFLLEDRGIPEVFMFSSKYPCSNPIDLYTSSTGGVQSVASSA